MTNTNLSVSVVICTHNPRGECLEQVLTALKDQTLAREHWELLLVDNASVPALAGRIDLSWHPRGRHVREMALGLTRARLRGVHDSSGDLIVLVDDDNVLCPDYLAAASRLAAEWPILGAWGGECLPEFEEQPPEWTKPYWGRLVIRPLDRDVWSNLPHVAETMPNGAGMCVRRAVAEYYAELHASGKRGIVLDRRGSELTSGGDTDLAACACDLGLGVGLFTVLKLTHLIPRWRLKEDYLVRLIEGLAYSTAVLASCRTKSPDWVPPRWSSSLAYWARLLVMNRRQRRFYRAALRGERRARRELRETRVLREAANGLSARASCSRT